MGGNSSFDLVQLLMLDVRSPQLRLEIAQHIAVEAERLRQHNKRHLLPPMVISDYDDTIQLNWIDRRLPRGTVYPGSVDFLKALTSSSSPHRDALSFGTLLPGLEPATSAELGPSTHCFDQLITWALHTEGASGKISDRAMLELQDALDEEEAGVPDIAEYGAVDQPTETHFSRGTSDDPWPAVGGALEDVEGETDRTGEIAVADYRWTDLDEDELDSVEDLQEPSPAAGDSVAADANAADATTVLQELSDDVLVGSDGSMLVSDEDDSTSDDGIYAVKPDFGAATRLLCMPDIRMSGIVIVTARPPGPQGYIKRKTLNHLQWMGMGNISILMGSLRGAVTISAMVAKKLENVKQLAIVFPEFDFVFLGDSGQGDAALASHMSEYLGTKVRNLRVEQSPACVLI